MNPMVLSGMFIGAMMAFLFCGLTMNAVGRAASHMSLNGSPTVSPTTVALCTSLPLPPKLPSSIYTATLQWVKAENAVTDAYLSAIPFRDKVRRRLSALADYRKTYSAGALGPCDVHAAIESPSIAVVVNNILLFIL